MGIAFMYVLKHPFSEYGVGNNGYLVAETHNVVDSESVARSGAGYQVHNLILQVGSDLGSIPMALYLAFLASLYLSLWQVSKQKNPAQYDDTEMTLYLSSLSTTFIVFLVGAFFLPVAYRPHLYYIAGIICAAVKIEKTRISRNLHFQKNHLTVNMHL